MKILLTVVGICLILVVVWAILLRARRGTESMAALRKFRYAHRGLYDKAAGIPENSMEAFSRAVARGFGAELDVHLLRDGTLAVFHDSDLKRCANVEGQIEDLDLEGLRKLRLEGTDEQVPLFDDVLALFEGKQPLIIELKTAKGNHRALAEAVCRRLDSYTGDFCIESFDPFAVADVRKLRPGICRGQLSMNFLKEPSGLPWYQRFLMTNVLLNWYTRPDFLAYQFSDRDNFCLDLARRVWGVQEVSWTIRSKEDLLACEKFGSIGIFEKFDPEQ